MSSYFKSRQHFFALIFITVTRSVKILHIFNDSFANMENVKLCPDFLIIFSYDQPVFTKDLDYELIDVGVMGPD